MPREKVIIKLSSTALGKSSCALNFKRTVIDGYKELTIPAAAIYGIALAKFLDVMYKTNNPVIAASEAKKAFALPKEDNKKALHLSDERHLLTTCLNVWATFAQEDSTFSPLLIDDKPATEVTFDLPYFENEYIIVHLCGTMDKVGKFHNGPYAVGDWKSTSYWDENKFMESWELNRQLRLYTLVCKLSPPDSILGRIGATHMGAFIDAIFLDKDPNATTVKRGELYQYSDIELDAFRDSLDNFILGLSEYVRAEYYPKEGILNGTCEQKYGKCSFWAVCKNPEHIGDILLRKYFKQQPWEPLNYNGL